MAVHMGLNGTLVGGMFSAVESDIQDSETLLLKY